MQTGFAWAGLDFRINEHTQRADMPTHEQRRPTKQWDDKKDTRPSVRWSNSSPHSSSSRLSQTENKGMYISRSTER